MRNPIACLITDTHAKDDNLKLVEDIYNQAIQYCVENSIEYMFFLGDFFTQRDKQSLDCLLCLLRVLIRIKKNGITLVAIQGNHDKTSLVSEKGYMSIYKHKIDYLFEKEGKIELGGYDMCFLPYFKEGEEYSKRLTELNASSDNHKLLFTHIAVNGIKNNDGSSVTGGINTDLFDGFDKVFVGHYHNAQSINNIHYIGSAYQGNFGEDTNKGFTILYDDISTKLIKTKYPKYKKTKIDVSNKKEIQQFIEMNQDSKDHVRLIITGSREDLSVADRTLLANAEIDIKFEGESQMSSLEEKEYVQKNIVMSNKDLLSNWIRYSKTQQIQKELFNDGLKMIKECGNL